MARARDPRVTRSKIAQHQEPADQNRRNGARHQHESALDEIANRLAEPPQQSGEQEESEDARDQRGESEGDEVEFRDPAHYRHELEWNRGEPLENDDPCAPLREAALQYLVFVHCVAEFEHWPTDRVEEEIADRIPHKAAKHRGDRAYRGNKPGAAP